MDIKTKREEIREGLADIIMESWGKSEKSTDTAYNILSYLHREGVERKIAGEFPKMSEIRMGATWEEQREISYSHGQESMIKAGYTLTKPLLEA